MAGAHSETITSEVANEWGFVEVLVDDDELDETVAKTVASIVQAAPLAVRAQKRLTRRWETHNINDAIQLGIDTLRTPVEPMSHVAMSMPCWSGIDKANDASLGRIGRCEPGVETTGRHPCVLIAVLRGKWIAEP